MRRPTRPRRLSIAAIVSLLAFAVVAGEAARSFWIIDGWTDGTGQAVGLIDGGVIYTRAIVSSAMPSGHYSSNLPPPGSIGDAIWGVSVRQTVVPDPAPANPIAKKRVGAVDVPLWPLLLLLLIMPTLWLIARPANAPAFPLIAHAKQVYVQINEQ